MTDTPPLLSGIRPTVLDAAVLVGSLREVYRFVQHREKASNDADVRTLCREIRLLVEGEIESAGGKRAAWDALKKDLSSALLEALHGEAPPALPRPSDHPPS